MFTVYHNVLTPIDFIRESRYLQIADWKFQGYSTKESDIKFWYHDLNNNPFYTNKLLYYIKDKIGFDVKLETVYANGQTHGLCGDLHIDSDNDESYTFIIYMNEYWNVKWGGQTVLYKNNNEIASIIPEPNKAILFKGNILHVGLEPTRHFTGLRTTVAFKILKI